ncbi:TlpA family protein disulfide reductase [Ancylomarina longa]|uniref:TlpA family protein disulfide reductase n=1 Tax=Ancylomarina longa TaxID=2487017 RepID=A0A434AVP9_9BACT|nr:TlpA disulfide reductase family protein [Ancylomarina longa]RUT78538.1 TlpA family protein disulfide reductase [Ancylomarina longa]
MNKILILIGLFMGIYFTGMSQTSDSRGYIVKAGQMAPNFTVALTDGKKVELSQFRGKVVMLQFTASWCGVCRKEMPHIESEIWKEHKGKDFILIGLDRDEPLNKAESLIAATKITYPLGLDEGANIYTKYADKESGVTCNVIIDREGKIIFLTRLFNPEEFGAMKKVIEEELAK